MLRLIKQIAQLPLAGVMLLTLLEQHNHTEPARRRPLGLLAPWWVLSAARAPPRHGPGSQYPSGQRIFIAACEAA
jgi:hypothetical protein